MRFNMCDGSIRRRWLVFFKIKWSMIRRKDGGMPRTPGILLVVMLAMVQPAWSSKHEVCVHLFSSRSAPGKIELLSPAQARIGGTEIVFERGSEIRASRSRVAVFRKKREIAEGAILILHGVNGARTELRVDDSVDRSYRGTIRIAAANAGTLRVLNDVQDTDYITSVVGSEAPPGAPLEMLKAQAILSQTILSRLTDNAILDDSTQTQGYGGFNSERPEIRAAAAAVAGKILTYDGRPATIYFHSTCGGRTSAAKDYFAMKNGSLPYLKSVPCKYCKDSPFWKETIRTVSLKDWKKVFGEPLPVVADRDVADRPVTVVVGETLRETGYAFWLNVGKRFGWDKMPGSRFSFKQSGDEVELKSNGAGHGVGLCQWGAIGLARAGKKYPEIIDYYYHGCKIR